ERVARAWRALVLGEGAPAEDAIAAVRASYAREVSDEFVEPIVLGEPGPAAAGSIQDGDAVVHMNFRPDRARELTRALTEPALAGEERCLVPSPRCATYDLEPAMSAVPLTDEVVRRLGHGAPDLVVLNYANADMVGHTGDLAATVKAVEVLDACLARVARAV